MTGLGGLVGKSVYILRETRARFRNPCVLWSTGKDSTATLSLCREAFLGEVPFPVVHIDTGYKFPEIYEFRERLAKEWGLDLVVAKNEGARATPEQKFECCHQRKTLALKRCVEEHGFDAVVVSIRRDEHGIRMKERFFSPRTPDFRWLYADQPAEPWGLFQTEFLGTSHVRVHPLLHWTVSEVWEYVRQRGLPVNPLYFKGYTSLGCEPCTAPTLVPPPKSLDELIGRLGETEERAGRAQDKEEAHIMQRLRALGYM